MITRLGQICWYGIKGGAEAVAIGVGGAIFRALCAIGERLGV